VALDKRGGVVKKHFSVTLLWSTAW